MTISIKEQGSSIHIDVEGVIKGASDSQSIKDAVDSVSAKEQEIHLNILHSFAITSTIIGYLRKKVSSDGLNLKVKVSDSRLYELLEELNLIEALNVVKVV